MWKIAREVTAEIIFPKRCRICRGYGSFICQDCKELLDISSVHNPDRSRKYLKDIYSAGSYENKYLEKIIHNFKYEPFCQGLGTDLAQLIIDHFQLAQIDLSLRGPVIVPVPLADKRIRWRGFNQAQVIAERLGTFLCIPVDTDVLKRTRETKTQTGLDRPARHKNINGAFNCKKTDSIKNKSVLIIDDVVTTGATMEECARVLIENGASSVTGISIARASNSGND